MVLRVEYYCWTVVVTCSFYDLDRDLVGQDQPPAILPHRRRRSEISPNGIVLFTFGYSHNKIFIEQNKNNNILSKNKLNIFNTHIMSCQSLNKRFPRVQF